MTKQEKMEFLKSRFEEIKNGNPNDDEIENILNEIAKENVKLFFELWTELIFTNRERIKVDEDMTYWTIQSPLVNISWWCEKYIGDSKWWKENYTLLLSNEEINKIIFQEACGKFVGAHLIRACILDGNYEMLQNLLEYVKKNEYRKRDFVQSYDEFHFVWSQINKKKISDVVEDFIKCAPTQEAYKKCMSMFLKYQAVVEGDDNTQEEEETEEYTKITTNQEIYSGIELDIHQTALEFNSQEFIVHLSIESWSSDTFNVRIDECILDEDESIDIDLDIDFDDDIEFSFRVKRNIRELSSVGYQMYITNLDEDEEIRIPNVVFEV